MTHRIHFFSPENPVSPVKLVSVFLVGVPAKR